MKITSYAHSDTGRVRELNEDQVYIELSPARLAQRGELYLVADGMGGHLSGEIASQQAIESIVQSYYEATALKPFQALKQAIEKANAVIYQRAQEEQRPGMGTTIVAAARENDQLHVAHVGDSRLYLVRHGEIRQVTRDHSLVAEQVAAGILSEEEAAHHPQRNVISRAVGTTEFVAVEFASPLTLQEGDIIILCSDGLTEHLGAKQILSSLQGRSPKAACHALVEAANQAGGRDNISVIVCQVGDVKENAPPPPIKATPSRAKKRSPIIAMIPLLLVLMLALGIGSGIWWLISSGNTANEIAKNNSANSISVPATPSLSPQATIAAPPPALETKTPSPAAPTVTKRPTFTITATAPSTEEPPSTATIPPPTEVPLEPSPSQAPTSEPSPSQAPTSEASLSEEATSLPAPSEEPSLSPSITVTLESVPAVLPPQILLLAPDDGTESNESTLEFSAQLINPPANEQVELRMGRSEDNLEQIHKMQIENDLALITLNAPPNNLAGEWFWQIVLLDLSTEESFSSEVRRLLWQAP